MVAPASIRFLKRLTLGAACLLLLLPFFATVDTSSITDDALRPLDTLAFEVRGAGVAAEN